MSFIDLLEKYGAQAGTALENAGAKYAPGGPDRAVGPELDAPLEPSFMDKHGNAVRRTGGMLAAGAVAKFAPAAARNIRDWARKPPGVTRTSFKIEPPSPSMRDTVEYSPSEMTAARKNIEGEAAARNKTARAKQVRRAPDDTPTDPAPGGEMKTLTGSEKGRQVFGEKVSPEDAAALEEAEWVFKRDKTRDPAGFVKRLNSDEMLTEVDEVVNRHLWDQQTDAAVKVLGVTDPKDIYHVQQAVFEGRNPGVAVEMARRRKPPNVAEEKRKLAEELLMEAMPTGAPKPKISDIGLPGALPAGHQPGQRVDVPDSEIDALVARAVNRGDLTVGAERLADTLAAQSNFNDEAKYRLLQKLLGVHRGGP